MRARSRRLWIEAIAREPEVGGRFQGGQRRRRINFLKGQVMKLSKGKANPQLVGEILTRKLQDS